MNEPDRDRSNQTPYPTTATSEDEITLDWNVGDRVLNEGKPCVVVDHADDGLVLVRSPDWNTTKRTGWAGWCVPSDLSLDPANATSEQPQPEVASGEGEVIEVRIAVAVSTDSDRYGAAECNGRPDEGAMDIAMEAIDYENCHKAFITARIPKPRTAEIQAESVEVVDAP